MPSFPEEVGAAPVRSVSRGENPSSEHAGRAVGARGRRRASRRTRASAGAEAGVADRPLLDVLEHAPSAVVLLRGPEHVFVFANAVYRRAVGPDRPLIGLPVREALPEVSGQGLFELLDLVYATDRGVMAEERLVWLDADGDGELEEKYFTFSYQPTHGPGGEVDGIFVNAYDVTRHVIARREAVAERERMREELAATAERERIAMDLHDRVLQQLFGVSLLLASAAAQAAEAQAPHAALDRAQAQIRETTTALRRYVETLRTGGPESGPLTAALRQLARELAATGLEVACRVVRGVDALFGPAQVTHLLAVVREAAANAVRHGRARRLTIRAARTGGRFVLTIGDDGRGFDTRAPTTGAGLRNLRQRSAALGGTLAVVSRPGAGTRVRLEVPLAPAAPRL